MKHRIILTAIAAVSCLVFTRCNEDTVIDFNQDINVTIQGIVYDNNGNVPLSNVNTLLVGKDSLSTDEDGSYQYNGNKTGSHLMKFSRGGYATMVQLIEVSGTEFTAEEIISSSAIFMYEANQTLNTTLKISNGKETTNAANVPVTITLTDNEYIFFEDNVIETSTDADGLLSVSGLPDVYLEIAVEFVDGDFIYSKTINVYPGTEEADYLLDQTSALGDLELVESNIIEDDGTETSTFAASDNVTFTFSESIEEAEVSFENPFDKVAFDLSISGSTVTVDPVGTGLEGGSTYSLYIEVTATNGNMYDMTFNFDVAGDALVLDQVSGFDLSPYHAEVDNEPGTSIAIGTTLVVVFFEEVEGATEYEIFGKHVGGTDEFVKLNANQSFLALDDLDDDEIEYSINLTGSGIEETGDGYFDDGDFEFIIRAVSGSTYGEFSNSLVVGEGDEG